MILEEIIHTITKRLEHKKQTRIIALGASESQRRSPGMHWLDCLELGLNLTYGPYVTIINSGVGGNNVEMQLERFEEDVAKYKPHLTIITTGANDAVGEHKIPIEQFKTKLKMLHCKVKELGVPFLFQTYYAFNRYELGTGEEGWIRFNEYMQALRSFAYETNSGLIDHLKRWAPLQEEEPELYQSLMIDPWHLNNKGNLVLGCDMARVFKLNDLFETNEDEFETEFWHESLEVIERMDALENQDNG